MAKVSSSQIIANMGINLDIKSLKKVTAGFKQMEKYYQSVIAKMDKKDTQREQKVKKSIGKTLNEYQKMFKQIQKGSDGVNFSNMATGIGAVVEMASKAIGMLNKGNERVKSLLESTVTLENFARNMGINTESVQLLEQGGAEFGIGESDIRGFISAIELRTSCDGERRVNRTDFYTTKAWC